MKLKVMTTLFITATILAVAFEVSDVFTQAWHAQNGELPERDEFRQTYQLSPGARIEVSRINGPVEIETSNTDRAEVHIIRSARSREDLAYHKVIVEAAPTSLVVRGEREKGGDQEDRHKVRQQVILKIPRTVDLTVKGVNGRVEVGEIDGPVTIDGINGKVEVAQATSHSVLSGINGSVTVAFARLGEQGISVKGINGAVELRFANDLDADLSVSGINGSVYTEMPNVTVQGKVSRSNFRARIGAGGAPISVSGVNGRVRLARAT